MDIFELLKNDHRMVNDMMKEMEDTPDAGTRKALFERMKAEVVAHTKAEDKIVYSNLQEGELSETIEHAREEHREVDRLLDELSNIAEDDEAWMHTFMELKRNITHHVREEEEKMIPQAKDIIGEDRARSLAQEMEEEKKNYMPVAV